MKILLNNGWNKVNNKLIKIFIFSNFKKSIDFVNKIADLSERKNHHPNICIDYNKVEINLWTHSAKTVTEKDFNLSKEIDKINENSPSN